MKSINHIFNEALIKKDTKLTIGKESEFKPNDKRAYGEFGEKWYDKCKNLSYSGSWRWCLYLPKDFKGFIEDFEKNYVQIISKIKRFNDLGNIRYDMCMALKNNDIDEFVNLAETNKIENFLYCGKPESDYIYGSHILDTYMLLKSFDIIKHLNKKADDNWIWYNLFKLYGLDWYDNYKSYIKNMSK